MAWLASEDQRRRTRHTPNSHRRKQRGYPNESRQFRRTRRPPPRGLSRVRGHEQPQAPAASTSRDHMGTPVGRSASKGAAADQVGRRRRTGWGQRRQAPLRRPSWKPERGFCHNEFGAAGVGTVDQDSGDRRLTPPSTRPWASPWTVRPDHGLWASPKNVRPLIFFSSSSSPSPSISLKPHIVVSTAAHHAAGAFDLPQIAFAPRCLRLAGFR